MPVGSVKNDISSQCLWTSPREADRWPEVWARRRLLAVYKHLVISLDPVIIVAVVLLAACSPFTDGAAAWGGTRPAVFVVNVPGVPAHSPAAEAALRGE